MEKIENEPLLTADEEYELANQIAEGRSADTVLKDEEKSKLLSEQERSTLQNKSELGKIAWDRMIESNLHLVVRTAQRYRQPNPGAQSFEKNDLEASVTRERVRQVESKIIYYIKRSLERRKQS